MIDTVVAELGGGGYRYATEELELGRVTRSDLGRVKFIVSKS